VGTVNRRIRLAVVVGLVAFTAAVWTHTAAGDGDDGPGAPGSPATAPSVVADADETRAPAASYRRPRVTGKPGRRVFGPRADAGVSAPDGSRIRCSLDRGPFTPCGERIRLRDLDEGAHRLRIRVRTPDGEVHRLGPLSWTTWLVTRPGRARAHVARIRWSAPVFAAPGGRRIGYTSSATAVASKPTRMAAIYEKVRQADPSAFLGPWALHLTSLSAVHRYFDGGPGRIALHGRGAESLFVPLGTAASNGCVRIDNRFVSWIANNVPSGTPVEFS